MRDSEKILLSLHNVNVVPKYSINISILLLSRYHFNSFYFPFLDSLESATTKLLV